MAVRISLQDFLGRLQGVYKSIDMRITAVKSDDMWHNALTVVRFSYLGSEDVDEQQKELENKWGKVQTSNFQIYMEALAFAGLKQIRHTFNEGKRWLWIFEPEIRYIFPKLDFGRSIDLLSLEGRFEKYGYTERESEPYPFFEAFTGKHSPLLEDERLQSEVKSQTLFDLYPLIRELLEVDFSRDTSFDFIVGAPFYAATENVDFEGQRCKIQVKFHKNIKALAVSAIVRKGDRENAPLRDKASCTINLEESEELSEYMRLWTKQLELLNAAPADYLAVSLIQTQPTALDIEKPSFPTQISRLLESKKPEKAPLVTASRRFLTENQLEQYLLKPIEATWPYKKGAKDPADTFELAVAWLLGLCGFSIVWLGQTKHEILREDKVARFSIDILASHHESENLLLLIGCTVGSPNSSDIDNLKNVRRMLLDEVFKDTQLRMKPFVFSAAPELSNKERDGVKVLDGGDIRGILNYVRRGEIQRALNEYFGYELGFKIGS